MRKYLNSLTKEELLDLAYFSHDHVDLASMNKDKLCVYVFDHICEELTKFETEEVYNDLYYYFEDQDEYVFSEDEYCEEFYNGSRFLEAIHFMKVRKRNGDYHVSINRELMDRLLVSNGDGYDEVDCQHFFRQFL